MPAGCQVQAPFWWAGKEFAPSQLKRRIYSPLGSLMPSLPDAVAEDGGVEPQAREGSSRFRTGPGTPCPVHLPIGCLAEGRGLDPLTASGPSRVQSGAGTPVR